MIGHELAHFAGEDSEYSLRVLPLHDAVGHSAAAAGWRLLPAAALGAHMMRVFDHAIGHWSRMREFAADTAGLSMTDASSAGTALIRSALVATLVERTLDEVTRHPRQAPPDLLAHLLAQAQAEGVGEPQPHLADSLPHPTERHPATLQRIAALGIAADAAVLAQAGRPVQAGDDGFARSLVPD